MSIAKVRRPMSRTPKKRTKDKKKRNPKPAIGLWKLREEGRILCSFISERITANYPPPLKISLLSHFILCILSNLRRVVKPLAASSGQSHGADEIQSPRKTAAESPPHFAKCGGRQQRGKTAADATATAANMAGDLWAPFIVPLGRLGVPLFYRARASSQCNTGRFCLERLAC